MLGGQGKRRYFVAFQNNAESRGTGGLLGVYGILEADRGRLRMTKVGSNQELKGFAEPVVSLGKEFDDRYNPSFGAAELWVNTNLSPHFPYSGQIWLAMWQRQFGERLDGVLATDPVMLSYLLEATGPLRLPTGEQVSAGNVVELTESTVYSRFEDTTVRKEFLQVIAVAVSEQVLHRAGGSAAALGNAVQKGAAERRLLLWSRHPVEAAALAGSAIGGTLPQGLGPYAGLVLNNGSGGKLDYYLDRTVRYDLGACDNTGFRRSTVTVTLTNDTPDTPLPDYVVIRADDFAQNPPRGSNVVLASLYAAEGAELRRVLIDGVPTGITAEFERGRPVFTMTVELAPKQSRTIVYELKEPVSDEAARVPEQPLARRQRSTVTTSTCSAAP